MMSIDTNKKLTIVANWKMNPTSSLLAINLFNSYINEVNFNNVNLIIAPPAIYVNYLKEAMVRTNIFDQVFLSAQNICYEESGAYTGEISANMVKDAGCDYTIIGHSERRNYFHESNHVIAKKFVVAIKNNLVPIVCLGENLEQFNKGEREVIKNLDEQIDVIFDYSSSYLKLDSIRFFLAYEPIWSIGTGVVASNLYINTICSHIRSKIKFISKGGDSDRIKILYGGSVNKNNCKDIFQVANIDGALVGGACLSIDQFKDICNLERVILSV